MKVLIISDVHANYPALEAVLKDAGNYDKLFFLGDVVDYGPHPKKCLNFIKNNADYLVRGNHDNALGYNTSCNSMVSFREYSIATRKWHKTLLNNDEVNFLRNMPILEKVQIENNSFLLAHASPRGDVSKYLTQNEIRNELNKPYPDFILVGHTHIQYKTSVNQTLIVNPGSVGLARDGREACYAIYNNGIISIHRTEYDVQKTISDLMKSPLSIKIKEGLIKVLLNKTQEKLTMTSKNKLSENHTRSLSVTSRLIEKSINDIELVLNGFRKNYLTEIIEPSYSKEEREKILKRLWELKEVNQQMFQSLSLEPNKLTEERVVFAQLSYLWTILLDSKPEKLKRYGDLAEHNAKSIDEFIEKLLMIIDKLKQIAT